MQNVQNSNIACCLTCCDDGVDDLQDCAHEVSIHSMLSSKLPGRGQRGGVQVIGAQGGAQGGAQRGAHGGASIQGATVAPSAYPLIPVLSNAGRCQVMRKWLSSHVATTALPDKGFKQRRNTNSHEETGNAMSQAQAVKGNKRRVFQTAEL